MDDGIHICHYDVAGRADSARSTDIRRSEPRLDLMLIEPDDDCADALEALLASVDGVGSVSVVQTLDDALRALDDGVTRPAAVFIATHSPTTALLDTLLSVRRRLPGAAIILLSVYPERVPAGVAALVDRCISKDTDRRELQELLETLTPRSIGG
jgi:hypothetical protein